MTDHTPRASPDDGASSGGGAPGSGPGPAPADLVEPAAARIVAVDDEPANLDLLRRVLAPVGYEDVVTLDDPRDVLPVCREEEPDLMILDLRMPHMDGFELYRRLADELSGFTYVPVLFLTADESRRTREKALSLGGQDYLTKPLSPREVRIRVRNLLTTRALHRELHEMNRELDARVDRRTCELEEARIEILERLALAAEYRDDQTGEHTERVGRTAARLARELGLDDDVVETIRRAAPLHDVGKIGIHDSILLKSGGLTDAEFDRMETHTLIGADILGGSRFPLLETAAEIARHHHEWWDGSGYPDGLSEEQIPLSARIVAVADVFDSLTHDRNYKDAWDEEEALALLERRKSEQFDPRVVDALFRLRGPSRAPRDDGGTGGADRAAPDGRRNGRSPLAGTREPPRASTAGSPDRSGPSSG